MKTKSKTLQIPMDSSLSAKWDDVCSQGKNIYNNNAGILYSLLDIYEAHRRDVHNVRFASAFAQAVRSQGEDVQLPKALIGKFKVEGGHLWTNVLDKEASKEQKSEVFKWVRME